MKIFFMIGFRNIVRFCKGLLMYWIFVVSRKVMFLKVVYGLVVLLMLLMVFWV